MVRVRVRVRVMVRVTVTVRVRVTVMVMVRVTVTVRVRVMVRVTVRVTVMVRVMKKYETPTVTGKWLYCCGTIPLEVDEDNGHELEFYSSPSNLKRARKCWKECGLIKVKFTYYDVKRGKRG